MFFLLVLLVIVPFITLVLSHLDHLGVPRYGVYHGVLVCVYMTVIFLVCMAILYRLGVL